MPPINKENALTTPSVEGGGARETNPRQQTVALEVPVTVNGARPVDGSDKREPFSETTKTVLVHGAGAVIRLNAPVAVGQLLFLTNDKSKKEIVCQVIKSKNYRNVSGYVELEFTEPVVGFWGMRFPGDRVAPQTSSSGPGASSGSAYAHVPTDVEPLAPLPTSSESSAPSLAVTPAADPSKFTGLVGPESDVSEASKVELRPDNRAMTKADLLAPAASSPEPLKLENSKLQEQLSTLLSAEQQTSSAISAPPSAGAHKALSETTEKLVAMADSAAVRQNQDLSAASNPTAAKPPSLTVEPAIQVEEVKIPAWLQPAARNAVAPATDASPKESSSADSASEKVELQQRSPSQQTRELHTGKPPAPIFGRTLLSKTSRPARTSSSASKSIWVAATAAAILVTAAGATWYVRHSPQPVPNTISAATLHIAAASTAAPAPNSAPLGGQSSIQNGSAEIPVSNGASSSNPDSSVSASASVSSPVQPQPQAAVLSERVPKVTNDRLSTDVMVQAQSLDASSEVNRPALGKVRLKKPINTGLHSRATTVPEPAPEMSGEISLPSSGSLDAATVSATAIQPAAPALPVGGDVLPAHLISSVPPVYPAIAKAQHVAGAVRIDALIDATGRVSAMKVVSGNPLLHQAAKDALRQWKYQPATLNGNPVSMHLTVTIQFRLQ